MFDLLEKGIIFFNSGQYFDAHEAWEDLWRPSGGPLRLFYQGLVQAAVGMHHLSQGNLNGTRAQLAKSLENLQATIRENQAMITHDPLPCVTMREIHCSKSFKT